MTDYWVECSDCDGTGREFTGPGAHRFDPCATCSGRGFVPAPPLNDAALRERASRAAFDAFYAEGTPYSEIEREMFGQVADAVLAILPRGGLSAEDRGAAVPGARG